MSEELEEYLHDEIEALTKANMQLQEEAEEQKQRIKRLEEAGDAMCESYEEIETDSFGIERIKQWRKAKEAKP